MIFAGRDSAPHPGREISRLSYEQQRFSLPRSPLDSGRFQPNSPSCGNQTANISLTRASPRLAHDPRPSTAWSLRSDRRDTKYSVSRFSRTP